MTPEIKNQYDEYLKDHIAHVKEAYDWLCLNLPELITSEVSDDMLENILAHDRSKYSDEEYIPYAEYFYGRDSKTADENFDYAWLHHIHYNPHHWQYWILHNDDKPVTVLEMPYVYIIEMICDWMSFSIKVDDLHELSNWYNKHKSGIMLGDKTRAKVESIINKIESKILEK